MSLDVEIGIKNARFRQGLEQMRGQAKAFSGDLKSMVIGAFGVGAIVAFAAKMREVQNQALRLGASAESVQRISKVAKQADVDFEGLAKTINKVTMEAGKAASGDKGAAGLFEKLHIDAKAFISLSPEQKLEAIAAAFQKSRTSGEGTTAMLQLLGERGTSIIPLLTRGPEALKKGLSEVEVQANSTVAVFAKFSKQVEKIQSFGAGVTGRVIGGLRKATAYATWAMTDNFTEGAQADLESENMKRRKAGQKEITGAGASHWIAQRERQTRDAAINGALKEEDKTDNPTAAPADDFSAQADDAEKLKSLREQIAEESKKYQVEELQGEARINELIKQRQALAGSVKEDTVEGLEAKKQVLQLDHEINEAQKSQKAKAEEAKKSQQEKADQEKKSRNRSRKRPIRRRNRSRTNLKKRNKPKGRNWKNSSSTTLRQAIKKTI